MVLEIQAPKIQDIQRRLGGMSGKATIVMTRAINDTIKYVSKEMANEAKKNYVVKVTAAKKTLSIRKAKQSSISGEVLSKSDKKVPLLGFKNKPTKRAPDPPAFYSSQVLQGGSLKALTGSDDRSKGFIATMKSGHTGVFQRTGRTTKNGKAQIAELFGPAIPSMFKSQKVSKQILDKGQKHLSDRLKVHIKKVMEVA